VSVEQVLPRSTKLLAQPISTVPQGSALAPTCWYHSRRQRAERT